MTRLTFPPALTGMVWPALWSAEPNMAPLGAVTVCLGVVSAPQAMASVVTKWEPIQPVLDETLRNEDPDRLVFCAVEKDPPSADHILTSAARSSVVGSFPRAARRRGC